jgi:hypothetical protein
MKRVIVTVVLAALAAAGCAKEAQPPRNYVNANKHFRMNKPEGWRELADWTEANGLSEANLEGTVDAAFISPADQNIPEETEPAAGTEAQPPAKPMPAIIAVKTCDAPESGGGAQILWEREKANLINTLGGGGKGTFMQLEEGDFTTSNGKAHYVRCAWKTKDGEPEKGGLFVFVTSAKRGAIVVCACKKEDYPVFEDTFKSTCESFFLDSEQ